jgi:hypothetical protein
VIPPSLILIPDIPEVPWCPVGPGSLPVISGTKCTETEESPENWAAFGRRGVLRLLSRGPAGRAWAASQWTVGPRRRTTGPSKPTEGSSLLPSLSGVY